MKINNSDDEFEDEYFEDYNEDYNDKVKNSTKYNKNQKKKSGYSLKKMIFICIFVVALGGILFSPIFSVKNINITEMERYTKAEICQNIGLAEGINILSFNLFNGKKELMKDSYFESVDIKIKFPNTINIEILERKVRGYVPYMGSYLYIDEYGRVLDVSTSFTKPLPVVQGLEFNDFQLGEVLVVKNQVSFDVILKIAQMMTKYNLLDIVVGINVSEPDNIIANVNKVEVFLGGVEYLDEKIRTMAEIIKSIPEDARGTLDLRDLSKPLVFKYLT